MTSIRLVTAEMDASTPTTIRSFSSSEGVSNAFPSSSVGKEEKEEADRSIQLQSIILIDESISSGASSTTTTGLKVLFLSLKCPCLPRGHSQE